MAQSHNPRLRHSIRVAPGLRQSREHLRGLKQYDTISKICFSCRTPTQPPQAPLIKRGNREDPLLAYLSSFFSSRSVDLLIDLYLSKYIHSILARAQHNCVPKPPHQPSCLFRLSVSPSPSPHTSIYCTVALHSPCASSSAANPPHRCASWSVAAPTP